VGTKVDISPECYSARLLFPFGRLLRRYPQVPQESLAALLAMDADERVPISAAHELLTASELLTGDHDLGLKAAREIQPGEYGALEYAARSAATWADALHTVARYMRLINDALRFSVHVEGEHAHIQLDSTINLPRASADFQSAAFFVSGIQIWPPNFEAEYEAWFAHPQPDDTREYEITFPRGRLRFSAPFNGFVAKREYLALPLHSADPNLHSVLRKHADALLAELPSAHRTTERVRDLIAKELAGGRPTLRHIARKVSMSERTLSRHLSDEGTTFKEQLDELRQRAARRYLSKSDLALSEIAFLLGFSQAAAFHRAFRRWTGQTPLEYRQASLTRG